MVGVARRCAAISSGSRSRHQALRDKGRERRFDALGAWCVLFVPVAYGCSFEETVMVQLPDVRYARSGDLSIAFQVVGDSRPDVVFVRGIAGDLVSTWDQPLLVRHVEGLAACGRLIMVDRRGTGLSDRVREVHSAETAMDDVRAVMDSVDSQNAVLWAGGTATGVGVLFAATYPERCAGLVLFDPRVKGTRSIDYPWALDADEWRDQLAAVRSGWGTEAFSRNSRTNGRRKSPTMKPSGSGLYGTCVAA